MAALICCVTARGSQNPAAWLLLDLLEAAGEHHSLKCIEGSSAFSIRKPLLSVYIARTCIQDRVSQPHVEVVGALPRALQSREPVTTGQRGQTCQ